MANFKYLFVAGAPGSKWSSVVKNIYYSPSIDRSDYTNDRTYHHNASGKMDLMHLGAYFDPGMEFGDFFDNLKDYTKEECEAEFDAPFTGEGIRIIKSHVFCNQIDVLKERWPECPIVCVYRPNDACLGWWVRCGEFYITYPTYHDYYENLPRMGNIINRQNAGLRDAVCKYPSRHATDNRNLSIYLGIQQPPEEYYQDYAQADVNVRVI